MQAIGDNGVVLLYIFRLRLDGKHVVFGQVVDGMSVVRAIEGYGSRDGKTSAKIVISESGQL